MRNLLILLLSYILATPALAIYDLAAINIIPNAEGTTATSKFCFQLDTSQKEMYLALTTDYQNFLFFSPELTLTAWQPPAPPPVFLQRSVKPVCYGPFPNDSLQGLKLFAGVGNSFQDVIDRQQYLRIFDGFPTLIKEEKPWTVMVYMVGSTLERERNITKGHASKDILEMLAGTRSSTPNPVNVVLATGGSSREGWNTVKYSLVRDGQLYVLQDLGESQMSEPQTLIDFVSWAKENFPSPHNALILWNHGGGTQGFGQDTSQALHANLMSLDQMHQAYQTIREQLVQPLDMVVYDACLMATIEVAEVTKTVANAMAASIEIEPEHGTDYEYLLTRMNASPPPDGLTVGEWVKAGYLEYSQQPNKGNSFRTKAITYSVFDLTQLSAVDDTLLQFANEFKRVLVDTDFLTLSYDGYKMLSLGIIRAPGYPVSQEGRVLTSLSGKESGLIDETIRIDFYNVLQTVSPNYPELYQLSQQLLTLINGMVTYEGNIKDRLGGDETIRNQAGRVSIDITIRHDDQGNLITPAYLENLSTGYQQLYQDLAYYSERRRGDTSVPEGKFKCPGGYDCAAAKWWELPATEVINIDGYYGQLLEDQNLTKIYLIHSLYRSQSSELEEDLEIGVNGYEACQYQLCVNETDCEEITVTANPGGQLEADILLNDTPALLTFCQEDTQTWASCSVVQQTQGLWGRADQLYPEDTVAPTLLQWQSSKSTGHSGELTAQLGATLTVTESPVTLRQSCEAQTATIIAAYAGLNGQQQLERLCDKGDCVCQENDPDESCQQTNFQFKAGVRIKVE